MSRGEKFATDVRAEFDLSLADEVVLDEVAAVLDLLDAGGLDVVEQRQQRALLSRLLYQLALPEPDAGTSERRELTSRKASRASRIRWQREAG